jgi:membrane carboxypeptidase/penicillin-binding protein
MSDFDYAGGGLLTDQSRFGVGGQIERWVEACGESFSWLSDWSCGGIVSHAARHYSRLISTPAHFVEMLLWIEDKRFAIHIGLDPVAVLRALYFDLRGRKLQGASTIPQQVYNIRWRRAASQRSLVYKLKQACWSIYLSVSSNKAAILSEYVDSVYWGRSFYGLDRAAYGYFKKTRDTLSVAESFFLAERLANPNRVSGQRILNLVTRDPIRSKLVRHNLELKDIIEIYEQICGTGGEICRLLAR